MHHGVLELADGRCLAYAEMGDRGAPPVFYFHGSPGSRRELTLSESVFERRKPTARVLALNRPGYGASTSRTGFGFLDWPADVAEAADRLGVGRFAVLGASGGGPFALACGYAIAEQVTRIGIVAGSAPIEATGMSTAPAITAFPANALIRRLQFGTVAFAVRTRFGITVAARRMHSEMRSPDRMAMERPEVWEWFIDEIAEAYSDGGGAASHEAGLYRRPWGFDIGDVTSETLLWYGAEDATIPVSAGRWLAGRLPDATLTVWPRHGHFSWAMSDEAADVIVALAA